MLFLSGFIMTDHNHVRRGCHYHVRRGPVRLYESWFDSMSRWFDHELPQPRPTWLWLPRPFPPGSSSARRSSSAIHIHGGAGGDYPVCGCEQEYATLRTSRCPPSPPAGAASVEFSTHSPKCRIPADALVHLFSLRCAASGKADRAFWRESVGR